MKNLSTPDGLLGLTVVILSVLALAVWVPLDIETGLVEKVRRQVRIGDAFLPVLGLGFVLLGGVLALASAKEHTRGLSSSNAAFLLKLFACLIVAFILMRWLGPIAVLITGEEAGYRALRDEPPWKYIGFVAGGTVLVAGLMALVERRFSIRGLIVGLVTSLVLIALYDLPFDDLLLPPNGDV